MSRRLRCLSKYICSNTPRHAERFHLKLERVSSASPCFYHSTTHRAQTSSSNALSQGLAEHSNPTAIEVAQHTAIARSLLACPGCGALAQTVESGEPGYFSTKRRVVSKIVGTTRTAHSDEAREKEAQLFAQLSSQTDPKILELVGFKASPDSQDAVKDEAQEHPLCDRCHDLLHHHKGVPIHHPSMESLQETISSSPHKRNHIYHILDAADFPLSVIPKVHKMLSLAPQRSRNRRAKHAVFRHGNRTAELTFVITRADLLAPKKGQVDRLMPYLTEVLRDAIGNAGKDVRMGNVKCVSAKRGWWTKELKEDVWRRGGAGWMLGKVNVGKSNLFQVIFPKGKSEDINFDKVRNAARASAILNTVEQARQDAEALAEHQKLFEEDLDSEEDAVADTLLPPPRPETAFPQMPTVSSLPGTTASPIRIPFGKGRGELIDLPGLARSHIESFVRPEFRDDLVMKSRVTPEQYVIRPGQSLLLGGLIRITSTQQNMDILAYPFIPIKPHLTSTTKAVEILKGERDTGVQLVIEESTKQKFQSAGKFQLRWDVTKQRAGPLTRSDAAGLKVSNLPFRVFSTDILIESLGWVELVAQVRRKKMTGLAPGAALSQEPNSASETDQSQSTFPEVEIFSPEGRFIGHRPPMNAWLQSGPKTPTVKSRRGRPRRSMSGTKSRK